MRRLTRALRWVIGTLLLAAGGWVLYVAAFNLWVAGGPQWGTPEATVYAQRGNRLLAAGAALLIAGLALLAFQVHLVLTARRKPQVTPPTRAS